MEHLSIHTSMFDVTVMDNVANMHELLTACSVQLPVSTVRMSRWKHRTLNLCYYGVDNTPHSRPRAAALTHRVWRRSWTSNLPPDYDKEQTSPFASLKARLPTEQASRNAQRFAPFARECVSMPLGPGILFCAHGTTILTNCEPSELVRECIFYTLQVRTRTI